LEQEVQTPTCQKEGTTMRTASTTDTKHHSHPTWAQRLAARQHLTPTVPRYDPHVVAEEAIDALWALFDAAYREANAALEAMGEPRRIGLTRATNQRIYRTTGPDGSPRTITVSALLSAVGGRLGGGAFVGTDRSRLAIYVVPDGEHGRVRWRVATTGRPFTSALVHDLFLSVFGDDPEATLRLSPLSGQDLFQGIWG
jgi:DNA-binding phage protein